MSGLVLNSDRTGAARYGDGPRPGSDALSEPGGVPLITQYIRIAVRWRWLIFGAIGLALALGVVYTLLATPLYVATTRIEISRESARIVAVASVEPESNAGEQEFYQTQYGLLRSQSLAERVARELHLADGPDFFAKFGRENDYERLAGTSGRASGGAREELVRAAAGILLDNVSVNPLRLSRLVDIGFMSPDPALSARVSNAWARGFIQANLQRRYEANSYAREFLEGRLGQLRERLDASERQLVGYASREAIINIPVGGGTAGSPAPERSLTAESLTALNASLAEATADRIRTQSRLRGGSGASAESLSNGTITAMRTRRADAAAEYSRLMTQFEPDYPPVRALAAQIEQLDASIAREEGRVRNSLQSAYQDSVVREQRLAQNVEDLKQTFLDQRRRSIQYNIFQRDVDTNRQLYDGLLQRYKEIGIAGGVGTNNVSIVDPAQAPSRPSRPRPLINMLLALIAGIVVGVGLALAREQIDETVSDPSDLERRVGIPLLGVVPASDTTELLAELKDPKSTLIEAYLSAQTNLAFSTDHGIPRSLVVTSTRPAEGKSITAFAMAYTIARNGAKTLLIDGDMRSPSVHSEVGISNERGLSNYLSGTDDLDTLIKHLENEPFSVLPAGPQPPNAAELLRSSRFELLMSELLKRFDQIIVDSPPVMGLADAPIIASRTEAVVFVVEARGVKARIARLALARLRQSRARLLGAILTKFETKRSNFGYGYDYGYGYGYGRDDKKAA
jgi:capsular exopolysaccharide synthesis family protein